MGWESTALYYRVIHLETRRRLGDNYSARVIVDSLQFEVLASARSRADFQRVRTMLVDSGRRLEVAGAQALLIACNTAHRFADAVEQAVGIPLLHIADCAGAALQAEGHQCIGLLGTQATMTGSFYRRRLAERFGREVVIPDKADSELVNDWIVRELVHGRASQQARADLSAVVQRLASRGANAALLACTELGLAFGGGDIARRELAIPTFDTAVLHATAAVELSLAAE